MGLRDKMKAETESRLVPLRSQMDQVRDLQQNGPKAIEAAARNLELKIQDMTGKIESAQAKAEERIEALAVSIEPLAQAMVQIQDSAQATVQQSADAQETQARKMVGAMKKIIREFNSQAEELAEAERSVCNSANKAEAAARNMKNAGKAIRLKFLVLVLIGGLLLGTAAGIGSWILLKRQFVIARATEMWIENPEFAQQVIKGFLQ